MTFPKQIYHLKLPANLIYNCILFQDGSLDCQFGMISRSLPLRDSAKLRFYDRFCKFLKDNERQGQEEWKQRVGVENKK